MLALNLLSEDLKTLKVAAACKQLFLIQSGIAEPCWVLGLSFIYATHKC